MIFGSAIADRILEEGPSNSSVAYSTYTVQRGDSLSSIAAKLLGSATRWQEIWNLNSQISDPSKIEIGMVLNIPAGAVAVSSDPNKALPGPRVTAITPVAPAGSNDVPYMDDSTDPMIKASNFLNSPAFLIGAAAVSLLIILMATKKTT